jgi:glycosyltransferase involved in cell wall biosynthesis
MNILIDFTHIPLRKTGTGVYAYNVINNILQVDKINNYFLLLQDDESCFNGLKSERLHIIRVKSKIFRKIYLRIILEQLLIPFIIIKHKIDVVHSLHYSFPLLACGAKRVVTVHDMTFYLFPEMHVPLKRLYFRQFIRLSSRMASKIITISRCTADDYLRRFKIDGAKLVPILLGKDERFNGFLDPGKVYEIKERYGICGDYLLFIGTIEPRKNITTLIRAFRRILDDGYSLSLVIGGKRGWYFKEVFELVRELHLENNIIFTGFIDECDKPYVIAGATLFVYPSLYEGFGIPVLEALSCGVPTITSNVSSMPEVAGDAAILIDPSSIEELYHSIRKLLDDRGFYEELKRRSLLQSEKFSWEKTAELTIEVYNSLSEDA